MVLGVHACVQGQVACIKLCGAWLSTVWICSPRSLSEVLRMLREVLNAFL